MLPLLQAFLFFLRRVCRCEARRPVAVLPGSLLSGGGYLIFGVVLTYPLAVADGCHEFFWMYLALISNRGQYFLKDHGKGKEVLRGEFCPMCGET